jgi:hypothetical protein
MKRLAREEQEQPAREQETLAKEQISASGKIPDHVTNFEEQILAVEPAEATPSSFTRFSAQAPSPPKRSSESPPCQIQSMTRVARIRFDIVVPFP